MTLHEYQRDQSEHRGDMKCRCPTNKTVNMPISNDMFDAAYKGSADEGDIKRDVLVFT